MVMTRESQLHWLCNMKFNSIQFNSFNFCSCCTTNEVAAERGGDGGCATVTTCRAEPQLTVSLVIYQLSKL